jgi:hypothetical protein
MDASLAYSPARYFALFSNVHSPSWLCWLLIGGEVYFNITGQGPTDYLRQRVAVSIGSKRRPGRHSHQRLQRETDVEVSTGRLESMRWPHFCGWRILPA